MRTARIIIGSLLWLALALGFWAQARGFQSDGDTAEAARLLMQYSFARPQQVTLEMQQPVWTAPGNPIFMAAADGTIHRVGEIHRIDRTRGTPGRRHAWALEATAIIYPDGPLVGEDARLRFYHADGSLEWIIETLLPPRKREALVASFNEAIQDHRHEIFASLEPLIQRSVADAFLLFQHQIGPFLERHSDELDLLGADLRADIIDRRLAPAAREHLWPVVQREAEPLLEKLMGEIGQRIPWWRIGRMAVQDVFGGERVQREVRRFIEEEVSDVVEAHSDDIQQAMQKVITDVADDPDVQKTLRQSMQRIIEDERLNALIMQLVQELVIDNPTLHSILEAHWTGEEAAKAFRLAGERLEPVLAEMGHAIVADNDRIAPEFAYVLRAGLLRMDTRWYMLEQPARDVAAERPQRRVTISVYRGERPDHVPAVTPREPAP